MLRYIIFVFSLLIYESEGQRWHSSQLALTRLYDLQMEHFDVINNYLELETKRLEDIKSVLAAIYKLHHSINSNYLQNNIDAIKLMTQPYCQLRKVEDLMCSVQSNEVLKEIDEQKDLSGGHVRIAFQGIRRLQRFYTIPASDMASGRHNNRIIGDQMDVCDCYVMSKYCFEEQDMYGVLEWALEAYNKWKKYGIQKCVDMEKLKFYIVSSSVYTGSLILRQQIDKPSANIFMKDCSVIILKSNNPTKGFDITTLLNHKELHSSEDIKKFNNYFKIRNKNTNLLNSRSMINIFGKYEMYYHFRAKPGELRFRELCTYGAPTRILTKYSKCRYQSKDSPYRILMPFKEEDISSYPYIKIYHDVLFEEEISDFKKFASKNMMNAAVLKPSGNPENDRSGQVNWIMNYEMDSKSLIARLESFTGFSSETAESFQIVNYGLGGHYIPHYDTFQYKKDKPFGDRIVTVLFYMNDVQNDGSTVFPLLDIISPVEKGAALVWVNLNEFDGSTIMETLHGSCPILKGNKWIMTRWLFEEGQYLTYDWRNS